MATTIGVLTQATTITDTVTGMDTTVTEAGLTLKHLCIYLKDRLKLADLN